jgi:hypothetical protein
VRRSATDDLGRGIVVGEAGLRRVDEREEREAGICWARRRRRTVGAQTPETLVLSIVVSCGSPDRKRRGAELDLGGRESLDNRHGAGTSRTAPKIVRRMGGARVWAGLRRGPGREQLQAERQRHGAPAIGQEAEVADAHEAFGEHVQQEAAQEFIER